MCLVLDLIQLPWDSSGRGVVIQLQVFSLLLGSSCCPVSTNDVQHILNLCAIPPVAWDEI